LRGVSVVVVNVVALLFFVSFPAFESENGDDDDEEEEEDASAEERARASDDAKSLLVLLLLLLPPLAVMFCSILSLSLSFRKSKSEALFPKVKCSKEREKI
jgi:hypothetical protein